MQDEFESRVPGNCDETVANLDNFLAVGNVFCAFLAGAPFGERICGDSSNTFFLNDRNGCHGTSTIPGLAMVEKNSAAAVVCRFTTVTGRVRRLPSGLVRIER